MLYRLEFTGAFGTVEGGAAYADRACAEEIADRMTAELAGGEGTYSHVTVVPWRKEAPEKRRPTCPTCHRPIARRDDSGVRPLRRVV